MPGQPPAHKRSHHPPHCPRAHALRSLPSQAYSGIGPDGKSIVGLAQNIAHKYKQNYGERIAPGVLAQQLGDILYAYTSYAAYRPFGAHALVCGYDEDHKESQLYLCELDGTVTVSESSTPFIWSRPAARFCELHLDAGPACAGSHTIGARACSAFDSGSPRAPWPTPLFSACALALTYPAAVLGHGRRQGRPQRPHGDPEAQAHGEDLR